VAKGKILNTDWRRYRGCGVFAFYPESVVEVGGILPKPAAERFIRDHQAG
jgi:hypothetical protein